MIDHNFSKPMLQPTIYRPTTNIQYVQGEAGAKGYPVANGYTMLLMDSEKQQFYIKQSDSMGVPTMKTFKFEEVVEPKPEAPEYITKADLEEFKKEIKALLVPESKEKEGEIDV
jgi:hypothetical protein